MTHRSLRLSVYTDPQGGSHHPTRGASADSQRCAVCTPPTPAQTHGPAGHMSPRPTNPIAASWTVMLPVHMSGGIVKHPSLSHTHTHRTCPPIRRLQHECRLSQAWGACASGVGPWIRGQPPSAPGRRDRPPYLAIEVSWQPALRSEFAPDSGPRDPQVRSRALNLQPLNVT